MTVAHAAKVAEVSAAAVEILAAKAVSRLAVVQANEMVEPLVAADARR
ncbi:MAG TPA: hypothetical protein VGE52_03565 [Pirellulales bacterium]